MNTRRRPIVADRFYPGRRGECLRAVDAYLDKPAIRRAIGGVVPHAGWIFSGDTAGTSIGSLAGQDADTIVVFGAVHVPDRNIATVYPRGVWETPLGEIEIDGELVQAVGQSPLITTDAAPHQFEHSIEVEVPLIQRAFPHARLLPIMVRPTDHAAAVGRDVAAAADSLGRRVLYLASTDLTHYGPRYGFEPHGHGLEGIRWAKEVNDRRFIDRVASLDESGVVPEAEIHRNACGAGAVAATIAAAQASGCGEYRELAHTTSAESPVLADSPIEDSVGYEAGVFVAGG